MCLHTTMGITSLSIFNLFYTNFFHPNSGLASDNVLMNSDNPVAGTLFHKTSASQVLHSSSEPEVGAGWDSTHRV
jgi:hypothetical protein